MSVSARTLWVLVSVGVSVACGGSVSPGSGGGSDAGGQGSRDGGGLDSGHQGARDAGGPRDAHLSDNNLARDTPQPDVATSSHPYDGTTGKACTTNADCTPAGGPGIARCSNSVYAPDDYYPTAVCIVPSCSPVSDDASIHYCDGPDEPTSPGVCIPSGTAGGGTCLPKCAFDTMGDPATGCQGKDTCRTYNNAPENGYGYCWGGCTQNSDCQNGQHCQTDRGTCLVDVVPPTKTIGEACTQVDDENYACHCLYGGASETGYCTSFCIVGGAATCPNGFVCGADESRADGYVTQNTGMYGRCHSVCSAADGGLMCPLGTNSTCTDQWAAGPYCIVP